MKQTIVFDEFTPTYKGTVTLHAVAYSAGRKSTYVPTNLPITFKSESPSVLKVEGDQLTALDFGEDIVIKAIVPENDTYFADTVEQVVSVAKAPITIRANDVERLVFNPDPEFSYTVSGDFLFDEPSEGLASRLIGRRFERDSLASALGNAPVSKYFRDTSAEDILNLLF